MLEAGSLEADRALLECEMPDLLLLNAELPDGSGFDFCREVRLQSDLPYSAVQRSCRKDAHCRGLRRRVRDYLVKPYLLDTLLERIEVLRKQAPKAPYHARGRPPLEKFCSEKRRCLYEAP